MATYAAVLSLFHTLNHIKIHPRPPISLDQNQLDSLTQNLTFFQDFLERYPNSDSQEDDKLERYIAAASYAAEDIIETHIVDQIDHATSTNENISSVDLYGDLEKVIHDMGLIKREVMEIIQKKIMRAQHLDLHRISSVSTASMRQSSSKPVFDDAIFNQVLDKLTGRQSGLQIIPIVGMGGIEDYLINLSMLVQLWVAEGILKPIDGKSLEEVGKEYLKDLTDRNLILVPELRWDGRARYCKMHDLLRDVCLREALKQNFFCVVRPPKYYTPHDQVIDMERRICVVTDIDTGYSPDFLHALESASLARSLLYENAESFCNDEKEMSPSLRFRLLRVYSSVLKDHYAFTDSNNAIFKQANLRYISLKLFSAARRFFSMCSLSWNLQTLKVDKKYYPQPIILSEIWEMPLLRHVMFDEFALPDPPPNREDIFILENLQTLSRIINFKFSEEVIKRIPNIKKLKVTYYLNGIDDDEGLPTDFCLNNLDRLQKLESLDLGFSICDHCDVEKARRSLVSFPHSLKKLTLYGTRLNWEKLIIRLGSLPLLQLLRLQSQACVGSRWETTEELGEKLCNLRVLQISSCSDLKYWETDSVHFPRLEILRLDDLTK
ncbi:hypothetical protein ACS0TY_000195 [Phlomoides rotata]